MNIEFNFFLIIFIILIVILTIYYPISGHFEIKKLKKSIADGDNNKKIKFYRETIFWSWIPVILIFLLLPISGISVDSIGIKWIHIDSSSLSTWVIYPTIGSYIFYTIFI